MIVTLVNTDGHGDEAVVHLGDRNLTVMDAFSYAGTWERDRPYEAEFSALEGPATWDEIFRGNPDRRVELRHLHGWQYAGYGKVIAIQPTVVDFGVLELQVGPPTHDDRCIGEYVYIPIDRLDCYLSPSGGAADQDLLIR